MQPGLRACVGRRRPARSVPASTLGRWPDGDRSGCGFLAQRKPQGKGSERKEGNDSVATTLVAKHRCAQPRHLKGLSDPLVMAFRDCCPSWPLPLVLTAWLLPLAVVTRSCKTLPWVRVALHKLARREQLCERRPPCRETYSDRALEGGRGVAIVS